MEIVCIRKYKSQGLQLELTYGKSYEVIESPSSYLSDRYICIRNDRSQNEYYNRGDFVTIDGWRELKLKEIGV